MNDSGYSYVDFVFNSGSTVIYHIVTISVLSEIKAEFSWMVQVFSGEATVEMMEEFLDICSTSANCIFCF